MHIAIFGLGYVGSVMTGCLARAGHRVLGVDVQADKVDLIRSGHAPVIEAGLSGLIAEGVEAGRITATTSTREALAAGPAVSFICVGTPSAPDGSLDTRAVEAVCSDIGKELSRAAGAPSHTVAIRSTVMPGTTARCAAALPGHVTLCVNPEFMREGTAVADFMSPPYTLVGARDATAADTLGEVYSFLTAPVVHVEIPVAEILKTVSNTWHATKVSFANEVARLCAHLDIDPHAVMDLFVRDERLNLSASYLRPGFAYGGSCLPKDVEAIGHLARGHHADAPLLEGIPRSNRAHLRRATELIAGAGCQRVGFLGLSFKPGTDDLRGSPLLELVEFCLGKGLTTRVFDPGVQPDRLLGANRRFVLERIGHIADLLVTCLEDLTDQAELFVVGHRDPSFAAFCKALPSGKQILDLVRLLEPGEVTATYTGLSW